MNTKVKLLLLLWVCFFPSQAQQKEAINVKAVIKQLTLEEKVKLLVGAGMNIPGMGGALVVGQTEDRVPGAAGTSQEIERLGLHKVVFADGPAGVRISPTRTSQPDQTFYATAFPVATAMSSTFNLDLMERVGQAFGNEVKEYGVDILLAPALNIHRNPLGGRNFEYYSEDPLVSGKMAAAFVKGVQSKGVGTSIKHFAANNQETNRMQVNTIVSERALREIYLKGFEIAVKESKPWTVMSSYNKINGVYASESAGLLTTILRDEWGYQGFVMTDWFAGKNPVDQMRAGNDLLMPGTPQQEQQILAAVRNGSLPEGIIDRNVEAILNIYAKTPTLLGYNPTHTPNLDEHKKIAREAAAEGMVLIKNEKQTLPLANLKGTVALFGVGSYETISGGTGSGDVNKAYAASIVEGLQKGGLTLSDKLIAEYAQYLKEEKSKIQPKKFFFEPDIVVPEMEFTASQLDSLAMANTIGVLTITRTSGEFADRRVENDFNLTSTEKELIRKIADAFHKKAKRFVVLLNIGGVIETASWKDIPDAILVIWQPGQEGGHAVADILSGKVNPSAKLPMTFPVAYKEGASAGNFPGKELGTKDPDAMPFVGVPAEVVYEEDIFVGYRYFRTSNIAPSYPFGFGLSYTSFTFSDLKINELPNGDIRITCSVKNTGELSGKEVVQVYISGPQGQLVKPERELKAFSKTRLLKPGEKQAFEFVLTPYNIASYDASTTAWITEKGGYSVLVASRSDDISLKGNFKRIKTETVLKTNNILSPEAEIRILKK